jgi:hypothetical protein
MDNKLLIEYANSDPLTFACDCAEIIQSRMRWKMTMNGSKYQEGG